jgi:hypothetical protein
VRLQKIPELSRAQQLPLAGRGAQHQLELAEKRSESGKTRETASPEGKSPADQFAASDTCNLHRMIADGNALVVTPTNIASKGCRPYYPSLSWRNQ